MRKNPSGSFQGTFTAKMSFTTVASGTFSCFQNIFTWSEKNAVLFGHFDSQFGTKGVKNQTFISICLVFSFFAFF